MSTPQQCQARHVVSSSYNANSPLHDPNNLLKDVNSPLEGTSGPLNEGGTAVDEQKPSHGPMTRHEASSTFYVTSPLQQPSGQLQGRTNNSNNTNMSMFVTTCTPSHPATVPTTGRVDSAEQASRQHGDLGNVGVNADSPREVI